MAGLTVRGGDGFASPDRTSARSSRSIAERRLAAFRSDIDAWRDITIVTNCDQPPAVAVSSG
ncbi:hypothetical protein [Micromonospora sp. NPDC005710]|uniref:hypothetical protein n=1 Tax=Micromonospora sp. NPDC005710 TaxID=3157051 RepID=UPI0033F61C5E